MDMSVNLPTAHSSEAYVKLFIKLSALGACLSAASPALAIGDGPRTYMLVPDGTQIIALNVILQDGNSTQDPTAVFEGSSVSVDVVAPEAVQTFSIGGQQAAAFVVVPLGEVRGAIDLGLPGGQLQQLTGDSSVLGDIQVGAIFGVIGSPSLERRDYATSKPMTAIGVLAKLSLPTGEYSQDKIFNIGTNRWSMQLGTNISIPIAGATRVAPDYTTIDLLPTITFFGENENPFGADRRTQKPLYRLEAHVIRNLSPKVWVSIDGVGTVGGETRTDGLADNNARSSLELGASIAWSLAGNLQLKASYGGVVARNESGLDGSAFRLIGSFTF
jgi:hypothetical protein